MIDIPSLATVGSVPLAPASVVIVLAPTNGTAVPQTNGSILYTPTPGFTGSDTFTYTIADTLGEVSNIGAISMTISHGVPPTAGNVTAPVLAGQTNSIDVLSSATSDAPLVPGSVKVVTQPTNGTATVNTSTGAIVYTPLAGFLGTDSFTYTVGNTNLDTSAPATVSVDVGTEISNAKGVAHTLSFTDAAGGVEILSLNKGTAEIFFTGTGSLTTTGSKATVTGSALELSSITLSGTTKASSLSVKGSIKTPATVAGITDASPLGSINAPSLAIADAKAGGSLIIGQGVNLAGVGTLVFGNISSTNITIGAGTPGKFAFTAGTVSGTTLTSAVPITTLKATAWTTAAGDSITAPSIGRLTVAVIVQSKPDTERQRENPRPGFGALHRRGDRGHLAGGRIGRAGHHGLGQYKLGSRHHRRIDVPDHQGRRLGLDEFTDASSRRNPGRWPSPEAWPATLPPLQPNHRMHAELQRCPGPQATDGCRRDHQRHHLLDRKHRHGVGRVDQRIDGLGGCGCLQLPQRHRGNAWHGNHRQRPRHHQSR